MLQYITHIHSLQHFYTQMNPLKSMGAFHLISSYSIVRQKYSQVDKFSYFLLLIKGLNLYTVFNPENQAHFYKRSSYELLFI